MKRFTETIALSLGLLLFYSLSVATANPKNVIIMIADGCGYNQVEAASLYKTGERDQLIFHEFPVQYGVGTYSADGIGYDPERIWQSFSYVKKKPTDSAASATTMATGIKTYNGAIGVDVDKNRLINNFQLAEEIGKATGVVSSVQFSHATPAGFVAHNESRGNYAAIAQEMILHSATDVIMGCGHPLYNNNGEQEQQDFKYVGGADTWDGLQSGTVGSDSDGDGKEDFWELIEDRSEFQNIMGGEAPARVIGIPKVHSTLQANRADGERNEPFATPFTENVPELYEMVAAAINVLDADPDGFYLMIEGGAVDWASHGNNSARLIEEELAFARTVEHVVKWVNDFSSWDETLLIITADHETGYLTGPGSGSIFSLQNGITPVWTPLTNNGTGQMPGMEWHSGGHTNSLVPLFVKGNASTRFAEYVQGTDPVHGEYVDNTSIGLLVRSFLE